MSGEFGIEDFICRATNEQGVWLGEVRKKSTGETKCTTTHKKNWHLDLVKEFMNDQAKKDGGWCK